MWARDVSSDFLFQHVARCLRDAYLLMGHWDPFSFLLFLALRIAVVVLSSG